jgi:DNA-binding SARP family transcriptional activator
VRLVTLGGFAVERDGWRVPDADFGRQKARALLAVLACARGAVHREELVAALWPDLPERRGIAALHSTLYALRRVLEPHLSARDASALVVSEGPTYRLVLGELAGWDAREFLRAAAAGLSAPPEDALARLRDAEARYAGPLLPEWIFAPWTQPLRTELEEAHRAVLVGVAERVAEAGSASEAISRYRLLLALEPEREGWHRALMLTYAAAGERALALRQFHACRTLLRERLGVAPSRETRELHTRILREG